MAYHLRHQSSEVRGNCKRNVPTPVAFSLCTADTVFTRNYLVVLVIFSCVSVSPPKHALTTGLYEKTFDCDRHAPNNGYDQTECTACHRIIGSRLAEAQFASRAGSPKEYSSASATAIRIRLT